MSYTSARIARRVIRRILNPLVLSTIASYDVASDICQALPQLSVDTV